MCFQCIPSLKFRVEACVKFRQILSSGIIDHHDVLLESFLAFVKQNIRKAVKHEHTYVGPHIADRTVCC
jgi:hypothetical protein